MTEYSRYSAGTTLKMIIVPPEHYVVVQNPVVRDAKGAIVVNDKGEDKLRYGDEEIRFHQDPFPLYYGEEAGTFFEEKVADMRPQMDLTRRSRNMEIFLEEGK